MKTLLLIDANSLVHRSFHALPPLTSRLGEPTGALFGLTSALLKTLREKKPSYVAAAFDRKEPTLRKKEFAEYKAHRPPTADELVPQLVRAPEIFERLGIRTFSAPGYEADDVIGTFVAKLRNQEGLRIVILTGDLDAVQLVEDDHVVVETPRKGEGIVTYNEAAVIARYGLSPRQIPDYKGLVGDTSDNIPGVKGIGPKTAAKLLKEAGTLGLLLKGLEPTDAASKKILAEREMALLSKRLGTIRTDAPVDVDLESIVSSDLDRSSLEPYFQELGFDRILKQLKWTTSPSPGELPFLTAETAVSQQKERKDIAIVTSGAFVRSHPDIASSSTLKVAPNWKSILKDLAKENLEVRDPLFDLSIAGWLVDSDNTEFTPAALGKRFLKRSIPAIDNDSASEDFLRDLFRFLDSKLTEYDLRGIFETIEMPLVRVLVAMERWGIGVRTKTLEELSRAIDAELKELTEDIYRSAGGPFNLNSPRQVGEVLFERLKIIPSRKRKTATGQVRMNRDVLEELQGAHPIVGQILIYREDFKIRSGFVLPLLAAVESDGRVRTQFDQTGAATGRLSSQNPNLQNIPQESKWSSELRRAFVAAPGYSFLSLDYSQLELRLLAHASGDKNLCAAFHAGEDIHRLTAEKIFGVNPNAVTPAMRRTAKTLNFGVVYGMGPRSFAKASGVTLADASKFIREYHHNFPGIYDWQERVRAEARTFGYVRNQNGRRRWFLKSSTPRYESEVERAAVNMPLQSLGADILKSAMVRSCALLKERGWFGTDARLVLSIHDELLFEVRDAILTNIASLLKEIAENILPLAVPLLTETKSGADWGSMVPFPR